MLLSCLSEQDTPWASTISALTNIPVEASRLTEASSLSALTGSSTLCKCWYENGCPLTPAQPPENLFHHLCPVSKSPTQKSGHYKSWRKKTHKNLFNYMALVNMVMTLFSFFCNCLINAFKMPLPSYHLPGLELTASACLAKLLAFMVLQNFIPLELPILCDPSITISFQMYLYYVT